MEFHVREGDYDINLSIFSYNTLIANAYELKRDTYQTLNLDDDFYSQTTRKHQGIAYAILLACKNHGIEEVKKIISKAPSLKFIIQHFAYYSSSDRKKWSKVHDINRNYKLGC